MNFVKSVLSFFRSKKKIAFLDGDQSLPSLIWAYETHVAGTGTETHLVRIKSEKFNEPKQMRRLKDDVNRIYLPSEHYRSGKEVVDKFIGAYIQKAISNGYSDITVISSDYDFIDIFKMAVLIDKSANKLTFRMIIPNPQGRALNLPAKVNNIEIVKMKS